jgi:hypothetical protein
VKVSNIKCSIDVQLSERVSEDFLRQFALKLKKLEPIEYDRMFISYSLSGESGWATSHFNPDLEVKILGTTIEQKSKLKADIDKHEGEIIGKWIDNTYGSGTYVFFKIKNKIIMHWTFKTGETHQEKEMIQKQQSGKIRFEEKGGNDLGEYYLIESNGQLAFYDNLGFGFSMRPIK